MIHKLQLLSTQAHWMTFSAHYFKTPLAFSIHYDYYKYQVSAWNKPQYLHTTQYVCKLTPRLQYLLYICP